MLDTRLIVLDRDGVLNEMIDDGELHRGPWNVAELSVTPGAAAAVARASDAGYRIVVASNQPDVARGWVESSAVQSINEAINEVVPAIEHFYVCMHDNSAQCECRKPKPGMLLQAAEATGADPQRSWMVGDRWTDIAAGQAAGFRTVLIGSERSMHRTFHGDQASDVRAEITVLSLPAAVDAILAADAG